MNDVSDSIFEVMFVGQKTDSRGRRAYARKGNLGPNGYDAWLPITVVKAEKMLRTGRAVEVNS